MPTLGRRAYDELRRMLLHGEIAPGAQLVNRKLADEIGISMTPVREAINKLTSDGLVEQVPGSGAFARAVSPTELAQLFEIREALEPLAAAHAARHASAGEIAELRALVAAGFAVIRKTAASPTRRASPAMAKRWATLDQRIHETIFVAARNRWLEKVARDMNLVAFAFARQKKMPEIHTVDMLVQTWKCHRRLVRAIARRDAGGASATMLEHIRVGRGSLVSG